MRLLGTIACALLLAACGGVSSTGPTGPDAGSDADRDVRAAFNANAEAWVDGNSADVCAGFTDRYARRLVEQAVKRRVAKLEPRRCEEAIGQMHDLAEASGVDFAKDRQRVTSVQVDGDHATLIATSNDVDQGYRMVRKGDAWLIDADDERKTER